MASLIRTKRLLWGFIFLLLTAMSFLSYESGKRYLQAEAWVEHTLTVQGTISDLMSELRDLEGSNRGFLLTHDSAFIEHYPSSKSAITADLSRLRDLTRDNSGQQSRIARASKLITDKIAFTDRTQALSRAGHDADAVALVRSGRGRLLMADVASIAREMNGDELRLLRVRKDLAQHAQQIAVWGIGVGSTLTIILSLLSLITVNRDAVQLAEYANQLRALSLRDELTGLYNRRGWLELSAQALRMASRDGRKAAVIFVDLNGMKRINDQHGHEEGDRALRDIAELLRTVCRDVDVIARFGGDEFVIFSLDFDATTLDTLRRGAQAATSQLNGSETRPYRLSMSLGAAFFEPGTPETIDALLDRADAEMYAQKRARVANGGVSLFPPAPH